MMSPGTTVSPSFFSHLRDTVGSTRANTACATQAPASTPDALARKVAAACVPSGTLQAARHAGGAVSLRAGSGPGRQDSGSEPLSVHTHGSTTRGGRQPSPQQAGSHPETSPSCRSPTNSRGLGADVTQVPCILCQCRVNHCIHVIGGVCRRRHGRKARSSALPAERGGSGGGTSGWAVAAVGAAASTQGCSGLLGLFPAERRVAGGPRDQRTSPYATAWSTVGLLGAGLDAGVLIVDGNVGPGPNAGGRTAGGGAACRAGRLLERRGLGAANWFGGTCPPTTGARSIVWAARQHCKLPQDALQLITPLLQRGRPAPQPGRTPAAARTLRVQRRGTPRTPRSSAAGHHAAETFSKAPAPW